MVTMGLAVQAKRTPVTRDPFARTSQVQAWTMCPSCQHQRPMGHMVPGRVEILMPPGMRPTPRAWLALNNNTAT